MFWLLSTTRANVYDAQAKLRRGAEGRALEGRGEVERALRELDAEIFRGCEECDSGSGTAIGAAEAELQVLPSFAELPHLGNREAAQKERRLRVPLAEGSKRGDLPIGVPVHFLKRELAEYFRRLGGRARQFYERPGEALREDKHLLLDKRDPAGKAVPAELDKQLAPGAHELHDVHTTVRAARALDDEVRLPPPQKDRALVFFGECIGGKPQERGLPARVAP